MVSFSKPKRELISVVDPLHPALERLAFSEMVAILGWSSNEQQVKKRPVFVGLYPVLILPPTHGGVIPVRKIKLDIAAQPDETQLITSPDVSTHLWPG
jgi:hypothetical protein